MNQSEFSVAVLVLRDKGIPLVRDPKKPAPVYWKLPGGRSEEGETAVECAVRELYEEIGLSLDPKDLKEIYSENRGSHELVIYRAEIEKLPELKEFGNEGEDIQIFSPKAILGMQDLFPNHKRIIEAGIKKIPR